MQAHDLMSYPPENSVPAEHSWLLGSGQARFESSADALLSWTALRGAGLRSRTRPAAGPMYTGVGYDVDGNPTVASRLEADQRFDADGTPYVAGNDGAGARTRQGHERGR
jgi:hypothetical protein